MSAGMRSALSLLLALSALTLLAAAADIQFDNTDRQCGQQEQCKAIVDCPSYRTAAAIRRRRPKTCGFVGLMVQVCCPVERPVTPSPTPSENLTHLLPAECGDPDRLLFDNIQPAFCSQPGIACAFNGVPAEQGKWPWMVLLGRLQEDGRLDEWFCGGTLITRRHVLTAAHCLAPSQLGTVGARLGEYDLSSELDVVHQDRNITRITRHERYRGAQNDIALLEIDPPAAPSPTIRPICLPSAGAQHDGWEVEMAGFGYLEFAGELPDVLQELPLRVSDVTACEASYSRLPQFSSRFAGGFQGTKICALSRDDVPRDACPGDSGGPLMAERPGGLYELVGVVSTGVGCGNPEFPGIYTKVSSYVDWILKNLV